ncbi:MAG: 3'-5' exonuclease [Myxococcota bacterium]|nr:3'-5' exonuclease [Myxococcota bacterium]
MGRSTWYCIDIEASGPVPSLFDMISLGAVAVHENEDETLQLGDSFYVEIVPTAPQWDDGAEAIHGLSKAHLQRNGISRRAAMERLAAWVVSTTDEGTKPTFVGHNAPFDWSHVAWCFAAEGFSNPFGYKALCTKALATGVLGVHWLDSSKETIAQALSLPAEDTSKKHRADYDAAYQALVLKGLLERSRGLVGFDR